MGRKKQNKVYTYFRVAKEKNKSTCILCKKTLNSIHGANLLKHLKHMHKNEYEKIMRLNNERSSQNILVSDNTQKIRKECLNLVTIHGRPLAMLDDEAFQNILSSVPDLNDTINSKNIRQCIDDAAASIRSDIAREFMNKMISIKVDIASLSTRSFMGVNAQYMNDDGLIVLKNLAVIEMFQGNTAEYLKGQIMLVLQRFRIRLENVYSFTTDNGANMIKMSRMPSEENSSANQVVNVSAPSEIEEDPKKMSVDKYNFFTNVDEEDCLASDSESYFDADVKFEVDNVENEYTETVTSALSHEFNTGVQKGNHMHIGIVRSAAHSLQSAVLSSLQEARIKGILSDARKVVKRLMTQTYVNKIRDSNHKGPILDCVTRWISTVEMIERLTELKSFCGDNDSQTHLPESAWDALKDLLNSLLPAKNLIIFLRREQIALSDFYLQWLLCKINLNNINSNLSQLLAKHMTEKEHVLFDNDCFLSALFMDPRVNSTLTENQQKRAIINLSLLHNHLRKLTAKYKTEKNTRDATVAAGPSKSARLELDDFLNHKYLEKHHDLSHLLVRDNNSFYPKNDIGDEIEAFQREPLIQSTYNIYSYWTSKKDKYPLLYELTKVVLAAPASQVSVERLFSSIKFVVSKYRYNLKPELIDNILLIRNNALYSNSN